MACIVCSNVFVKNKSCVVDSDANQYMTATESQLVDVVDVSKFNLKLDHPNGSTAMINKIGNMNLSDSTTLTDVFFCDT